MTEKKSKPTKASRLKLEAHFGIPAPAWNKEPKPNLGRPAAGNPAASLRAALASPFMAIRLAGRMVVQDALKEPTFAAAARKLGMPYRTLERLRDAFPDDFKPEAP